MKFVKLTKIAVCTILTLIALSVNVYSAPVISTVSGSVVHGSTITLSGSGFGTKTTAAPLVWDNCSGTSITTLWSGSWPNTGTASYQLAYHATPFRNIYPPHSHVAKIMAGAHTDGASAYDGYNVMVWKTISVSLPQYIYGSFYEQADPNWNSAIDSTDNNFKYFDYSNGGSPYTMNSSSDSNWYVNYAPNDIAGASSTPETTINDDGGSLQNPDVNGHSFWWGGNAPLIGHWVKKEFEVYLTSSTNGYIKVWENGTLIVNYLGPTDKYSGTTKSVAFGGYARDQSGPNQWRYFSDIYFDTTASRVIICAGSNWASHGICENQIPTAWSTASVTATVNQGQFADNSSAYLYVVDSSGNVSAGKQITFGSSGTTRPSAPLMGQ